MREQLKKLAALKYASRKMSGDAPPAATVGAGLPDMVRHLGRGSTSRIGSGPPPESPQSA